MFAECRQKVIDWLAERFEDGDSGFNVNRLLVQIPSLLSNGLLINIIDSLVDDGLVERFDNHPPHGPTIMRICPRVRKLKTTDSRDAVVVDEDAGCKTQRNNRKFDHDFLGAYLSQQHRNKEGQIIYDAVDNQEIMNVLVGWEKTRLSRAWNKLYPDQGNEKGRKAYTAVCKRRVIESQSWFE